MSFLLSDTDYANLRGAYPLVNISPLTTQQEQFLISHFRGLSLPAAERSAGMGKGQGTLLMKKEGVDKLIQYLRQQMFTDVVINVEMLNDMTLQAHGNAKDATEQLKAIELLAKLNQAGGFATGGGKAAALPGPKDITPPNSVKALENMDDARLLELAALGGMDSLDPQPIQRGMVTIDDDDVIEVMP